MFLYMIKFSISMCICFSERGVDRTEVMRGSLHYLFDAVMPFLQVCSHRFMIFLKF